MPKHHPKFKPLPEILPNDVGVYDAVCEIRDAAALLDFIQRAAHDTRLSAIAAREAVGLAASHCTPFTFGVTKPERKIRALSTLLKRKYIARTANGLRLVMRERAQ